MKVLHVYSGNLFGGVESLLLAFARHRDLAPGMQSEFALCFEGRLSQELSRIGAPAHLLGPVQFSHPWSIWRARLALRKLLKSSPFDVVICHSPWTLAVFAPTVRSGHRPLGFWLHDFIANRTARPWVERLASRHVPDLAVCNSDFTRSSLANLFRSRTPPAMTIYCPVSMPVARRQESRRAIRQELRTSEGSVVLIQASRLERWKGHALHLRTLALLPKELDWVSWMAGGPQKSGEAEYLRELEELARELGIAERVRFLGQRADVPDLLQAADIHFQPNESGEPFGIAFVEALFAGIPVVTTNLGGAREILGNSGDCGKLCEARPEALADALIPLIRDLESRRALGRSGPARAHEIADPAQQLQKLEKALASL